ncbi:Uncharacterised protein [Mycobacteroides abscessus subsp. abscessus]|nr:Uncharacterised protein [Mycobacteroides abscessus subsp. abscessus]
MGDPAAEHTARCRGTRLPRRQSDPADRRADRQRRRRHRMGRSHHPCRVPQRTRSSDLPSSTGHRPRCRDGPDRRPALPHRERPRTTTRTHLRAAGDGSAGQRQGNELPAAHGRLPCALVHRGERTPGSECDATSPRRDPPRQASDAPLGIASRTAGPTVAGRNPANARLRPTGEGAGERRATGGDHRRSRGVRRASSRVAGHRQDAVASR